MAIRRPITLVCPRCSASSSTIKRDGDQRKYVDYYWRRMACAYCKLPFWWGTPLFVGQKHRVMRITPKSNDEGRTENINKSLPIPASLRELVEQSISVDFQHHLITYMEQNNKTPDTLSPADREALKQIMQMVRQLHEPKMEELKWSA